jgi:hypothetical protein
MAIQTQPEAPTASPAPREQSLSTFLHVETMVDLDNGQLRLLASTETNLGDLQEHSPARLLGMVADARVQLDRIERLAQEFEAHDTLAAIIAEHDLTVIVIGCDGLAEHHHELADQLTCWIARDSDGRKYAVVPEGQDPIERTHAVARAVADIAER